MISTVKRLALALCLLVPALPAAAADSSSLRGLVTGDDSRGWEGVGRLEFGGTSFCTGALISETTVLTAGHCLYDHETGESQDPAGIRFLAGWRNGRAEAYRGARRAVVHPGYLANGEDRSVDLALIELDQPIRNPNVQPFDTGKRAFLSREVGVVSYARDREDMPSLQDLCHVLGRSAGTLVLDCDVDFGSSGAPVFDLSSGAPRIISVVSAKAVLDDQRVSLGTSLEAPLAELRAMLAESDGVFTRIRPTVRQMGATEAAASTGAHFVKP